MQNTELHQHGGLSVIIKNGLFVTSKTELIKPKEMVFESLALQLDSNDFKYYVVAILGPRQEILWYLLVYCKSN